MSLSLALNACFTRCTQTLVMQQLCFSCRQPHRASTGTIPAMCSTMRGPGEGAPTLPAAQSACLFPLHIMPQYLDVTRQHHPPMPGRCTPTSSPILVMLRADIIPRTLHASAAMSPSATHSTTTTSSRTKRHGCAPVPRQHHPLACMI